MLKCHCEKKAQRQRGRTQCERLRHKRDTSETEALKSKAAEIQRTDETEMAYMCGNFKLAVDGEEVIILPVRTKWDCVPFLK